MKLTAVIFDWAGTLVDHGCRAPMAGIEQVFAEFGVPVSDEEARAPMGLAKRTHIERLLEMPRIAREWARVHGGSPSDRDADAVYAAFIPKQLAVLADHSRLIAGVAEAAERMRGRGLKIGTTTGYNRAMLECVREHARAQGFVPDFAACPEDVGAGRPAPFMCYLNALKMRVQPMWTMVKIGDTAADVEEGRNAGMWTIGITRTGNEVGRSAERWQAATAEERKELLARAEERLASAHFLAESAAACDEILDRIEARLERGERP